MIVRSFSFVLKCCCIFYLSHFPWVFSFVVSLTQDKNECNNIIKSCKSYVTHTHTHMTQDGRWCQRTTNDLSRPSSRCNPLHSEMWEFWNYKIWDTCCCWELGCVSFVFGTDKIVKILNILLRCACESATHRLSSRFISRFCRAEKTHAHSIFHRFKLSWYFLHLKLLFCIFFSFHTESKLIDVPKSSWIEERLLSDNRMCRHN